MRKNENGNAYILVLITMMLLFLMLTATLTVTRYEMRVSDAYQINADMRALAESGAEQAVFLLDGYLPVPETVEKDIYAINGAVFEGMGAGNMSASYSIGDSTDEAQYKVGIEIEAIPDDGLNISGFHVAVTVTQAYTVSAEAVVILSNTLSAYEIEWFRVVQTS